MSDLSAESERLRFGLGKRVIDATERIADAFFLIVYQRRDKGDDSFILSAGGGGTVPFTTADSNHVFRYESAE